MKTENQRVEGPGSLLDVGHVVKVNKRFSPEGKAGFVYEVYQIGAHRGVSIILEDGHDLGGFSMQDQRDYLTYVLDSGIRYQFTNALSLSNDYCSGRFQAAFL